jgi:protein-S-isoprenylcysteine O-methyltransferase Ste14
LAPVGSLSDKSKLEEEIMSRVLAFIYGIICYLVFFASFLYAIGFVGNLAVPKGIDDGLTGDVATAVIINLLLLSVFAVQHSVMARPGFKRVWTRIVPKAVERSTYVLLSSLALLLLFWQWRPLTTEVWQVTDEIARQAIWGVYWAGWGIVLVATFIINHFDLFGLRQVFLHLRNRSYSHPGFKVTGFYRYVRHPIMSGFVVAFWATPDMTVGHLLFAAACTGYILVGVWFEERDLVRHIGEPYAQYRREVPMLLPTAKPAPRRESQPASQ